RGTSGTASASRQSRPPAPGRPPRRPTRACARRRRRSLAFSEIPQDGFERVDDLVARRTRLVETQLQVERLGRRPEREHVVFRASGLRFGSRLAHLLACDAPLTGELFDEGG